MHDTIYMAEYREGEYGEEQFFWLDSRLGPLLQEIGKIVKRNWKDAEVYINGIDSRTFRIEVSHNEDDIRVTKYFTVTKYYV